MTHFDTMTQPKNTLNKTTDKSEFCNTNFMRTRGRRWAFTKFDYDDTIIAHFKSIDGECIFQEEICPETGRKHLQGAIKFANARTGSSLKKFDKTAHWEPQQKSWLANIRYCSKLASRGGKIYANFDFENTSKNDTIDTAQIEKFEKITPEDIEREQNLRFKLELHNFMEESLADFDYSVMPWIGPPMFNFEEPEEENNKK